MPGCAACRTCQKRSGRRSALILVCRQLQHAQGGRPSLFNSRLLWMLRHCLVAAAGQRTQGGRCPPTPPARCNSSNDHLTSQIAGARGLLTSVGYSAAAACGAVQARPKPGPGACPTSKLGVCLSSSTGQQTREPHLQKVGVSVFSVEKSSSSLAALQANSTDFQLLSLFQLEFCPVAAVNQARFRNEHFQWLLVVINQRAFVPAAATPPRLRGGWGSLSD